MFYDSAVDFVIFLKHHTQNITEWRIQCNDTFLVQLCWKSSHIKMAGWGQRCLAKHECIKIGDGFWLGESLIGLHFLWEQLLHSLFCSQAGLHLILQFIPTVPLTEQTEQQDIYILYMIAEVRCSWCWIKRVGLKIS